MYEYKTITLKQKGLGLLTSKEVPELETVLNAQAEDGWRYGDVIMPTAAFGESDKVILVLERAKR